MEFQVFRFRHNFQCAHVIMIKIGKWNSSASSKYDRKQTKKGEESSSWFFSEPEIYGPRRFVRMRGTCHAHESRSHAHTTNYKRTNCKRRIMWFRYAHKICKFSHLICNYLSFIDSIAVNVIARTPVWPRRRHRPSEFEWKALSPACFHHATDTRSLPRLAVRVDVPYFFGRFVCNLHSAFTHWPPEGMVLPL